jgi:hypothetical protein
MPGWFAPYFEPGPLILDDPSDYADPNARLVNRRQHAWMHTLGGVVGALLDAGLALRFLHEHDAIPWRMFEILCQGEDGLFRWPDRPWLPLAFSLRAERDR